MRIPKETLGLLLVSLLLAGCSTLIETTPDYTLTSKHGQYRVFSPDQSVVVFVSPKVGHYKKLGPSEFAFFINHEFAPGSSYGARIGFWPATESGTGQHIMSTAEVKRMTTMDGKQKHIENQRLAEVAGWDALFYSYPSPWEYAGKVHEDTIQTVLALKRMGQWVVYVELSFSHLPPFDEKYSQTLSELLQDYKVVEK